MKSALEKALNKKGVFLDLDELESIENDVVNEWKESFNEGLFYERTKFNKKEKVFSDEWKEQNKIQHHINYGYETLQCLMIGKDRKPLYYITQNDRVIVATVIQWLGTNIGFYFLEKALKKCGYKIVKEEIINELKE
jgi:hypothetical protein